MMVETTQKDIWSRIGPSLPKHFGNKVYEGWLRNIRYQEIHGGRIYLTVPSRFVRDWVSVRCKDKLLGLLKAHDASIDSIEFVISNRNAENTQPIAAPPSFSTDKASEEESASTHHDIILSNLDQRYTFDKFIVGKPNELAYAAAQRVANSDAVYFNPLFLYGGVGLGKTHLMHAIAWQIQKTQPNRTVLYMSAEQFMYRFVRALRHKDIMAFREQFRSVDVLMIDDVQFISGKDSTQEEFFHTFNALVDKKKQIILSADKSPSDLSGIQERVRSRLCWGLVADIHPTTYELRLGILQAKTESMDIEIKPAILEFLAHKITSNIRELEGALNRVVAHATLVGREITIDGIKSVLQDLLRANARHVTIEDIQKHVAAHYNIRISDLHSGKRLQVITRPRQIAMYLCKKLTSKSLPEIGRKFGGRDHTTVIHSVRKIEDLKEKDLNFAEDVNMLEHIIAK